MVSFMVFTASVWNILDTTSYNFCKVDAIVLSAGKLRKQWNSLSELRGSLYERRLERTVLRSELLPVKTAQFTQFFRQV
jgi:hypothetical protein